MVGSQDMRSGYMVEASCPGCVFSTSVAAVCSLDEGLELSVTYSESSAVGVMASVKDSSEQVLTGLGIVIVL